jgi:hypothetical protein
MARSEERRQHVPAVFAVSVFMVVFVVVTKDMG